MKACSVLIVGGGASGMTAALFLRQLFDRSDFSNKSIVLLEKNDRVGKKLLLTGNGRCNLSNRNSKPEHFHGSQSSFSNYSLEAFSPENTVAFFHELGLECISLEDKIFPRSLHASSVLDALRLSLEEKSIEVFCQSAVHRIKKENGYFITVDQNNNEWKSEAVLIATGGVSAPETGSTGDGYMFFSSFSHTVIKPLPAIVQVKSGDPFCKSVSGLKVQGIARLFTHHQELRSEEGEILFTDYGLSGPPILQLSGLVSRALEKNQTVEIKIDTLPDLSEEMLVSLLLERRSSFPSRTLENFLTGLFHRRIAYAILKKSLGKTLSTLSSELSEEDIKRLSHSCKELVIPVEATMGIKKAQVTAGGVATADFSEKSMQSTLCPGLFGCGEVLDIDGDCGGYNLQWAWSSAHTASQGIFQFLKELGE